MKKILPTLVFYLTTLVSKSQTPLMWTWVNGDQLNSSSSFYGIRGVPNSLNKPPARYASVSWTDSQGNLWLFGGGKESPDEMYNDLWKYDPLINQWAWMHGDSTTNAHGIYGSPGFAAPQNKPGARILAASWTDKDGNFWLFGGYYYYGGTEYGNLNDLWKYEPSINMWTWVKGSNMADVNSIYGINGVPDITNMPGGTNHASSWTDKDGNFWLFGGFQMPTSGTVAEATNVLWKYEPHNSKWTWVKGTRSNPTPVYSTQGVSSSINTPGALITSITWTDSAGRFWLFGGQPKNSSHVSNYANELWKYDPYNNTWTWMKGDKATSSYPPGLIDWPAVYGIKDSGDIRNIPGSRARGASWTFGDDNLWLWGGGGVTDASTNIGLGLLNDLWKYNITSNTWTWMKGDSLINELGHYGTKGVPDILNNPPSRSLPISWVDKSGKFWLFGAISYNDLWTLNASSYNHQTQLRIWAEDVQNDILVSWETSREVNTNHFVLEKGASRNNFFDLFTLPAAGYSITLHNYSYLDVNPFTDTNFYRIKIVNAGGEISYSEIVAIKINKNAGNYIYPNPVKDVLHVHLNGNNENISLQLFDVLGRKISEERLVLNGNVDHSINVSNLPKTMYLLKIQSTQRHMHKRFIKL